jgi:tRNA dimethylallyltransferase
VLDIVSQLPVVLLIGPTASGKSAAALDIAEQFNGEIISVDSALVYRHMNVGTAKPTVEDIARVPHHLIDLIDPTERYSAARFITDCLSAIADVRARGRLPLLVGGTMMYADALLRGMSDVPPTDETIRSDIAARRDRDGIAALHAELARVDPMTAARLPINDTQRIERALEVWMMTGVPLSAQQGQRKPALGDTPRAVILWQPENRAWLHARCGQRLKAMFDAGLVQEVRALRQRFQLHADLPSMRCVGYRQVLDVLEERAPGVELSDRALFATRQLAKRQLTWMRSMQGESVLCDQPDAFAQLTAIVAATLQKTGRGHS